MKSKLIEITVGNAKLFISYDNWKATTEFREKLERDWFNHIFYGNYKIKTMTWHEAIKSEFDSDYYKELENKLSNDRLTQVIYPNAEDVFKAFELTKFEDVKVVILGQDPYHDGSATGLAFSSKDTYTPSLRKINEGLQSDYKLKGIFVKKDLTDWAKQGVLLLNTVLTVVRGIAKSHANIGWEKFTTACIEKLIEDKTPKVFILWGKDAKETYMKACLGKYVTHILVIEAEHPAFSSYRKKSWEHNNCFIRTNEFLKSNNLNEIKWI